MAATRGARVAAIELRNLGVSPRQQPEPRRNCRRLGQPTSGAVTLHRQDGAARAPPSRGVPEGQAFGTAGTARPNIRTDEVAQSRAEHRRRCAWRAHQGPPHNRSARLLLTTCPRQRPPQSCARCALPVRARRRPPIVHRILRRSSLARSRHHLNQKTTSWASPAPPLAGRAPRPSPALPNARSAVNSRPPAPNRAPDCRESGKRRSSCATAQPHPPHHRIGAARARPTRRPSSRTPRPR